MTLERKTILLEKASVTDTGEFSGYANVFGVVDRGGDRVRPGAFAKDIPRFLTEGFISWGHDWGQMIAMPLEAKEDTHGLFLRAQFHSTPAAQEKRVITQERLDKGLSMGLSIGYDIPTGGYEFVREDGDRIRDLKELIVYETGLVAVPMNQLSTITAAKGGGLGTGLPYADHLDWVLDEVRAILARSEFVADRRARSGKDLSTATRERHMRLEKALADLLDAHRSFNEDTEPDEDRLAREWADLRARAIALGVQAA